MNPEDEAEEDGANIDLDSQRKGKCVVLKTSTRQVNYHIVRAVADLVVTVVECYLYNLYLSLLFCLGYMTLHSFFQSLHSFFFLCSKKKNSSVLFPSIPYFFGYVTGGKGTSILDV